MSFFKKILGDPNEKKIKELQPLVEEINQLESQFSRFSDEQLKAKTAEFKEKLNQGASLDDLLPEAFAAVREAAKRTLGQRHFDAQLIGGIVLHQGQIAEMKTGEGKTLAATLAVYLNALSGKGAHIITVNDYLARRDANWMGPVYHLLGLACACLNHEKSYVFEPAAGPDKNEVTVEMENLKEITRKGAYLADITYGTNNEFGFDYLRDNMSPSLELMAQRDLNFAIVDEIDSILIDEARTPLIISMPDEESTKLYEQFSKITPQLKENADYNVDEKMRAATLTAEGIAKVEKILGLGNIYQEGGIRYVHHLEQALRAEILFKRDKHYVVKNGEVIIVDDFTGRLMPGRRYSDGLHQALEAKEGVHVQQESRTLASITFQNYFRMYQKLAGMTGTAETSAEEFHTVYNLEVAVVPTNKPMVRQDLADRVYKSEKGKFTAIVREIKEKHQKGQPVLVGTVSIEKNELLSAYLKKEGIPHQILNAKNHEQEAQIIAQAGKKGAVTVATNMAGRGVDIILGGRPSVIANSSVIASERSERGNPVDNSNADIPRDSSFRQGGTQNDDNHDEVAGLGGLHVIGTERHEARRIDNQLRGRSGRQGDPGSSQFFVSLEDDLMRIFGGERVKSMMEMLKVPEDQPIESKMVSRAIESAQEKIEGFNFDARKHILEYDDVMNKQREVIYKKRKEVLASQNIKDQISEMIKDEISKIVRFHCQSPHRENWNLKEIGEIMKSIIPFPRHPEERSDEGSRGKQPLPDIPRDSSSRQGGTQNDIENELKKFDNPEKIAEYLVKAAEEAYQNKEKELKEENMRQVEKFVSLRTIDAFWMDHLDNMDHLRDSVKLRAYGQKDPLVEYKNEGMKMFQRLLASIQSNIVNLIYKISLDAGPASPLRGVRYPPTGGADGEAPARQSKKIGRNDPCPCGKKDSTGKPIKYKKCCYPKYGR